MVDRAKLVEDIHRAKVARILDLIRRATSNGTHAEVAEALARDWSPLCVIGTMGQVSVFISDLAPAVAATSAAPAEKQT